MELKTPENFNMRLQTVSELLPPSVDTREHAIVFFFFENYDTKIQNKTTIPTKVKSTTFFTSYFLLTHCLTWSAFFFFWKKRKQNVKNKKK